ncbi:hypothetical protein ACRAQ6_12010 [Erythrobacter sp. HA6-11]
MRVDHVVTLATPFLIFREVEAITKITLIWLATIAFLVSYNYYLWSLTIEEPNMLISGLAVAIGFTVLFGLALVMDWLDFKPGEVEVPKSLPCEVSIFRSSGDEATGALAIAAPLNWLAFFLIKPLSKIWEILLFALRIVGGFGGLIFSLILLVAFFSGKQSDIYALAKQVVLIPIGLTWVIFFGIALLRVPFGWDLLVRGYGYVLTVEASPPGDWQISTFQGDDSNTIRFAHSEIYHHIEVRERVSEIIKRTATLPPRKPRPWSNIPTDPIIGSED